MGRAHEDFNIVINNQNFKKTRQLFLSERKPQVKRGNYFRYQEVDNHSKGCIPDIGKGLVSKKYNDNNKITNI